MKSLVSIAILATIMLGGCTTMPGVFNGLGKDPMSKLIVYRTDGNMITEEQYEDVVLIARRASMQVGLQLSSATEAAASAAFPYGFAGAVGGIIESGVTAGIAGTAGFLGGLVNGWQTASYANVWLVADITEVTIRDLENAGDKRYHRLHVSAAFTGTGNTVNAPARGVIQR